ncbi:MAG: biotin/lipoyl-containing protein, partial [Steroidobacteraceae bacterium]
WRLNGEHYETLRWREPADPSSGPAGALREVALHYRGSGYEARVDGAAALQIRDARWLAPAEAGTLCAEVDGRRLSLRCHCDAEALTLVGQGGLWRLVPEDPLQRAVERESGTGRIVAPMPGQVTQLFVAAGQAVERGQPLLVLEAMKMEHTLRAPHAGQVAALRAAVGTRVTEGAELLIISE